MNERIAVEVCLVLATTGLMIFGGSFFGFLKDILYPKEGS